MPSRRFSFSPIVIALVVLAILVVVEALALLVVGRMFLQRLEMEARIRADPAFMSAFRTMPPQSGRPSLLVIGDSRANGVARLPLSGWNVVNRGIDSQTATEVLARACRDLVLLKPDHVLLIVGINDLKSGGSEESVARAAASVEEFARVARALGVPTTIAEVWSASARPTLRGAALPSDLDSRVSALNERYRTLAAEHGAALMRTDFLLDQSGAASAALTRDALHLNEEGNRLLAEAIVGFIRPPLLKPM